MEKKKRLQSEQTRWSESVCRWWGNPAGTDAYFGVVSATLGMTHFSGSGRNYVNISLSDIAVFDVVT